MSQATSPFEIDPPSRKRLLISVLAALVAAAVILVTFVLPAQFGIDPTGVGRALGLSAIHVPADPRDPIPLPNPSVAQIKPGAPRSESINVTLEPGQQTEIKAIMDASQVIVYSWHAEGGEVYTDFHGHEPDAGDAFVRYEEQQSGTEGHGSLVAPFSGEHGWFWLNISEKPVTISLQFTGYHRDVKNYGLIND